MIRQILKVSLTLNVILLLALLYKCSYDKKKFKLSKQLNTNSKSKEILFTLPEKDIVIKL
ncbi:MAG: hypothetical protein ABIL45_04240 [candidate division WOR-3 bacterium]